MNTNKAINTKEDARQYAKDWQVWQSEQDLSIGEVVDWQNFFDQLATQYNLTTEFKENGII